jgi:hypothetical protein
LHDPATHPFHWCDHPWFSRVLLAADAPPSDTMDLDLDVLSARSGFYDDQETADLQSYLESRGEENPGPSGPTSSSFSRPPLSGRGSLLTCGDVEENPGPSGPPASSDDVVMEPSSQCSVLGLDSLLLVDSSPEGPLGPNALCRDIAFQLRAAGLIVDPIALRSGIEHNWPTALPAIPSGRRRLPAGLLSVDPARQRVVPVPSTLVLPLWLHGSRVVHSVGLYHPRGAVPSAARCRPHGNCHLA